MSTTALGIMQDSAGNGVDPLTHRRIIKGRWANTGVIEGLEVTGTSTLAYRVGPGNAVLSRGDSDGYTEAYWEGGTTDAVSAGDASRPRVDLVWMRANDVQQGDADNRVHVGVTEGTASASPVAPACPSGCVELAQMLVPAGATSTASATMNADQNYAVPYGASLGLLAEYWDQRDFTTDEAGTTDLYVMSMSVTVPTDRLVRMTLDVNFSTSDYDSDTPSEESYIFQVDGEDVPHTGFRWGSVGSTWQSHSGTCVTTLTAGTHTVRLRNRHSYGPPAHYHYAGDSGDPWWIGRRAMVWDAGVAQ